MTELKERLKSLNETLATKQSELADKKEELDDFEIDEESKTDEFDSMLDDTYEPFFGHSPSLTLKKVDPIMYNEELSSYVDSLEVSDEQGYKELESEIEELESEIYDLEQEIYDLEQEIEEVENDEEE